MSAASKLVVVTPFPPRRDAPHGGGRITAEAIAHLASRFEVVLLSLRADDEEPVERALVDACALVEEIPRRPLTLEPRRLWGERRRVALALSGHPRWAVGHAVGPLRRRLAAVVRERRPDVVQLEFLVLADLASALPAQRPPLVLVEHDARPSPTTGTARQWRRARRAAARHVDAVVAFSEGDAGIVRETAGGTHVVVIPPGLDPLPPAGVGSPDEVLFVGGFRHPPNVGAARRLVREIHPRVRRLRPGARLTLVGADPPGWLAGPGVVVTGQVADVRPFLERAAVVVVPVCEGGGVRIKVLEALASGKALVASRRAVEGIDVRPGHQLLVADGDDATAEAVVALLADDELRRRLGAAARAWAESELRWEDRLDRYGALYESLLRTAGARRR